MPGRIFGVGSSRDVFYPYATKHFCVGDFVLQSLEEAVAFRIEAKGTHFEKQANKYQITRTVCLYYINRGKLMVAFDDIDIFSKNLVLFHALIGEDYAKAGKELSLMTHDVLITPALQRAKRDKRVFEHPGDLIVPLDGSYSSHKIVRAMIGIVSEQYELFLKEKGFTNGRISFVDSETIRSELDDDVIVRPCSLGGDGYGYVEDVDAGSNFDGSGRVRGVSNVGKKIWGVA